MKKTLSFFTLFLMVQIAVVAQFRVKGKVLDENNQPMPFVDVYFKNSTVGTVTDDSGRFSLEHNGRYKTLEFSFLGYETVHYKMERNNYNNLTITLKEASNTIKEVVILTKKQPKKNNPAVELLKKIWKNKKTNGLKKFRQYSYTKYQKTEYDLNSIDEKFKNSKIFKGMEFMFKDMDTSAFTGKEYLPIFFNESVYEVYGDNKFKKQKEVLKGSQNSGFSSNQSLINQLDNLSFEYDIYDNYIKIFYKSFVSPLSRTGVDNYSYYLADSAFIKNKWCYNIRYYPRRKNELTFEGDFWVNDTTFAVKEINMRISKGANINWVKDIYIEQEYEIMNDSVFLLKRDYFLTDYAINKKEGSKGVFAKKTTLFDNYKFNKYRNPAFYKELRYTDNTHLYNKDAAFWEKNRLEQLNKKEKGIYKLIDTLKTTKKFRTLYDVTATLASGYYNIKPLNFDYGPIFSTFGYNSVEGLRVRAGGRTYFNYNDPWRVEGYTAYGFKDQKLKYGIQAKFLLDQRRRFIVSFGQKEDIEQIGAASANSIYILGRNNGSSSLVGTGPNNRLTKIKLTTFNFQAEPFKNFEINLTQSYKKLASASPEFSLDYNTEDGGVASDINQYESAVTMSYYPGRKVLGHGVETYTNEDRLRNVSFQYVRGVKGVLDSDFNYTKINLSYTQPWAIGGFGRLRTSLRFGKTFGDVPLALLTPVPGNQTYFAFFNAFNQLDFYEFVTDTYASVNVEHNFNGRIFSRIPLVRKLDLRAFVGFKAIWGELSDENIALNTTNSASQIVLRAPSETPYYEYNFGIGNIFKILRVDFNFRGNYLNVPNARKFGVTLSTGFNF